MRVLRFLTEVAKPYRLYLWGILFSMSFVAMDANIKPYLIKTIIDSAHLNNYTYIWLVVLVYVIMQVGLVGSWSFHDWCSVRLYPPMTACITQTLLNKINHYPYLFFQEHLSGSISAKLSNIAHLIPQMISTVLNDFFQISLMIFISIFMLSKVHYGFGLAMIVWVSIFLCIGYVQLKKATALSNLEAETDSQVWGDVVDYVSNMFTVKIFSSYKYEKSRLNIKLEDYITKSQTKILFLRSYFMIQGIIFSVYIIAALCGMIYLSQKNLISYGDFALFFMLNFAIINRLFQITTNVKNFITDFGAVDQALIIFLENLPDIQDKPGAMALEVKQGKIVFDAVEFKYKNAEVLFQNHTIAIEAGQKVGLVGYSGGGKSTFVNLILRLYDVTNGRILIDDQNIADVTQDSLRNSIAMIPQDPSLFHRNLMENIRYGYQNATDAEVIEAAKKAHAHEFIAKLPQSYQTIVGERGVKLSAGQRHKIAIARAILKNAPILILDEATPQIDSVSENSIQASLWALMKDRTSIVIAHRLSTLLRMDRIIVFEQGKIVEDGSHSELLANNGPYKTLWDAQIESFLPTR